MHNIINKIKEITKEEIRKSNLGISDDLIEEVLDLIDSDIIKVEGGLRVPWCNFLPEFIFEIWNELSAETKLISALIASANLSDCISQLKEPAFNLDPVKMNIH